jgi:hypothetical protein
MADLKQKLFDHYYPIEIDPGLTDEQKKPDMLRWYAESNAVLVSERFERVALERAVLKAQADGVLALRAGFAGVMNTIQAAGAPLLIFSGGISNVIEEVFAQLSDEGCPLPDASRSVRPPPLHSVLTPLSTQYSRHYIWIPPYPGPLSHAARRGARVCSTRIVANRMEFDVEGRLVAFADPLIHMYNKNQAVVPAFQQVPALNVQLAILNTACRLL